MEKLTNLEKIITGLDPETQTMKAFVPLYTSLEPLTTKPRTMYKAIDGNSKPYELHEIVYNTVEHGGTVRLYELKNTIPPIVHERIDYGKAPKRNYAKNV